MTVILAVLVFFAAIVRGYTGFGLSAIVITIMTYWVPAQELVPLLILLEITSSLLFFRSISLDVEWKIIGIVFTGAVISTTLALQLLLAMPGDIANIAIASLVLLATLILLTKSRISITPTKGYWFGTGIVMGTFGGLGSIGGLGGAVMLLLTTMSAAKVRTTMIVLLLVTPIYAALFSTFNGMMAGDTLYQWLIMLLPLIPGLYIGHLCFSRYQRSFRTITLIFLAVLSATMLAQSIF